MKPLKIKLNNSALRAERKKPAREEMAGDSINVAKKLEKAFDANDNSKEARKLRKRYFDSIEPKRFTIEFDIENKKSNVKSIIVNEIAIIRKKNDKINFKKSEVSFTEYRYKDIPVAKHKSFEAFKTYIGDKRIKHMAIPGGVLDCYVLAF